MAERIQHSTRCHSPLQCGLLRCPPSWLQPQFYATRCQRNTTTFQYFIKGAGPALTEGCASTANHTKSLRLFDVIQIELDLNSISIRFPASNSKLLATLQD